MSSRQKCSGMWVAVLKRIFAQIEAEKSEGRFAQAGHRTLELLDSLTVCVPFVPYVPYLLYVMCPMHPMCPFYCASFLMYPICPVRKCTVPDVPYTPCMADPMKCERCYVIPM